jgi:hypothetical protein
MFIERCDVTNKPWTKSCQKLQTPGVLSTLETGDWARGRHTVGNKPDSRRLFVTPRYHHANSKYNACGKYNVRLVSGVVLIDSHGDGSVNSRSGDKAPRSRGNCP